jgi:FAD synthetase
MLDTDAARNVYLLFAGTVLIHILAAVLRRLSKSSHSTSSSTKLEDVLPSIPSLYITCSSPFQEVEDFVSDSIQRYNMKIVRLGGGMKEGLEKYLEGQGTEMQAIGSADESSPSKGKRQVKAMFIGTRRTDPHGGE